MYVEIPERDSDDVNASADVNQAQDNIEALKGGAAATPPTTTIEGLKAAKLAIADIDDTPADDADTSVSSKWLFDNLNNGPYIPVLSGLVLGWTTNTAPADWLECDGSAISRSTYADLFSEIGVIYGNGNGSTTFNLPDFRGEFLRGYDNGAGNDPDAAGRTDRGDATTGDNVGTKQDDAFQGHYHNTTVSLSGTELASGGSGRFGHLVASSSGFAQAPSTDGSNGTPRITSETRPTNTYVMWIIKI